MEMNHEIECEMVWQHGFSVCTCANPRRVYVAARSGMVNEAKACAKLLRAAGFEVTSTWHDDPRFHNNFNDATAEYCEQESSRDESELQRANVIVRLSDGNVGTAGNCVEWGIARAYGLRLILVGPPCNVFDRSSRVITATAGDDLIEKVRA